MDIKKIKETIEGPEYDFLRDDARLGSNLCLLTMGGSIAYGTDTENSDIDVRGITLESAKDIIGYGTFEQFDNSSTDTVIYGLSKALRLLADCNPNVIEMLGCKPEHYLITNDVGSALLNNKDMFLSRKAEYKFGGYALAQLNRFRNALDRNNQDDNVALRRSLTNAINSFSQRYENFENGSIIVRKPDEKDGGTVTLDVTLKNFPVGNFATISNELSNILNTYNRMNTRNNKKDEAHINKHAMQLIRLYIMGADILERGVIETYREKEHDLLMDIRNGKFQNGDGRFNSSFEDLIDEYEKRFNYACKNSILPDKPDFDRIEALKMDVDRKIIESDMIREDLKKILDVEER